jgi:hypothetical protein
MRDQLQVVVGDFLQPIADAVGAQLDGVIGYNFLNAYRLTIDYPNEMLYLD